MIEQLLVKMIFWNYPEESFPSVKASFEVKRESCIIILMIKKCWDDKRFLISLSRCSNPSRQETSFSSRLVCFWSSSPSLKHELSLLNYCTSLFYVLISVCSKLILIIWWQLNSMKMKERKCTKSAVEKIKTNPEQPSKVIAITFDVAFKKPSFHSISASFSISLAL